MLARLLALLALAIAVVTLVVVLLTSSSAYVLHAQFSDAGQLVRGDLVTIAGHQVGTVGSIKLADNGLADVELDLSEKNITPVHSDSLATIGQLSLTGVANRFVGLTLSGGGRAIPSGGTLPFTQTRGIVDLDVLLDALTPKVRASLQQLLRTGAYFVRQPTAAQIHQGVVFLNPALSQLSQFSGEVVADRFSLQRLVSSTAVLTSGLAARSSDLAGAITGTAATLRQLATQRAALADILSRAPGVLGQGRGVLADVNYTLHQLNPAVRDLQPVAPRLATLLRRVLPATQGAALTVAGIQALVRPARAALVALPPAERRATPAVNSLTAGLKGITPILSGLRPYAPEVPTGFFNGVGGASGSSYDANGHYLKTMVMIQPGGTSLSGVLSLLGATGALGPFNGTRTRLLAKCPGGGGPPTADATGPWTNPDPLPGISSLCDPSNDQRP